MAILCFPKTDMEISMAILCLSKKWPRKFSWPFYARQKMAMEISMAVLCKLERFAKVNILRRFFARIFAALEIFARVSTICDIIFYFWQKK